MKKASAAIFIFIASTLLFAAPKNKRSKPADGTVFESVTVTSNDSRHLQNQEEGINRDVKSVTATNDGKTVTITVDFNGVPSFKEQDRIVIMIDDVDIGSEKTVFRERLWKNPATYTNSTSSIEFNGIEIMGQGVKSNNMKSSAKWDYNKEKGTYTLAGGETSITYSFHLVGIKDSSGVAYPTDTLKLVVLVSEYWNMENPRLNGTTHICDVVPSSSSLVWQTDTKNDSVKIDFNGAIEIPPLKEK